MRTQGLTWDELNEDQRLEVKQHILVTRNEAMAKAGTSYGELADADRLVSDEDAQKWAEGMAFSPDDFTCSAGMDGRIHEVRVTWPVTRVYGIWAESPQDAVAKMRARIDAGKVCVWTDGFETADGETVEAVESAEGAKGE